MKPAPFDYFAPKSLDEALSLLDQYGWEGKPIAGGQSLVPTMNFRLAAPTVLVDLNGIDELFFVSPRGEGIAIGAMTRQRTVERSPLVAERAPLIRETMPYIAHPQIRNRGTFGGSLAHADPAAELPTLSVALGARFRVQRKGGERWVEAPDFYVGLFATDLQPGELLTEIVIPPMPARTGYAFDEIARQHGNYAMAGAAAVVTLHEDGTVADARLVFLSLGEGPEMAHQAQAALIGQAPTAQAIEAAAAIAAQEEIDPVSDIHASAAYRRHLAQVLAKRVLTKAAERAKSMLEIGRVRE
jgi:carbon-monoxide dehydrogenase medium subunit